MIEEASIEVNKDAKEMGLSFMEMMLMVNVMSVIGQVVEGLIEVIIELVVEVPVE